MIKLKTLKDIEQGVGEGYPKPEPFCFSCDLREEAIKWIKHNKDFERACGFINDSEVLVLNTWIKHFFNITEEDLK